MCPSKRFLAGIVFVPLHQFTQKILYLMEETIMMVSVNELKRLILSIHENQLQVCIRYRTIGQLWHPNFLRIIKITESSAVLFHDAIRKRLILLSDLSSIIQFELDGRLNTFEPNFHYLVSNENLKAQ
jgi:hypothetical protein